MTYRILLSGGGTAGSVTPLIALVDQIRRERADVEFLFLGSGSGPEKILADAAKIPFQSIAGGKLRRYWSWQNVVDAGRIWRGFIDASAIMKRWRPHIAITAGSYVSVPVIWAAHRQGIKTLVHQQDVRPGLANRLMSPAADVISVSFRASMAAFPPAKVRWIGNPVRPDILNGSSEQARTLFHIPENIPVLLILGGSTGSSAINATIGSLAYRLVRHWFIIHVTGPERDFVELHDPHYVRFAFLTWQLPHALAAADLVVCRVGLGTLTELAALGKEAIFIPMPDSHQEDNAAIVSAATAGMVLKQTTDFQNRLWEAIEHLRQHPEERKHFGNNIRQLYNPQSLNQLVDVVFHLINE